ncbi:hypothetical protein [Kitasatospora sp. McL0602]|uniref:hypothetical protein n=1 Tax=Kitasatospora sp. McL0602 TaxID=3439530 RepID=UPI003F892D17
MKRTCRTDTWQAVHPAGPGEILVATEYRHPARGQVSCPAWELLAGSITRRGFAARRVDGSWAATPGTGVPKPAGPVEVHAVSFELRDGRLLGLAAAAAPGPAAAAARAAVAEWTAVLRTRRLVTGGDPLCAGERGARAGGPAAGVSAAGGPAATCPLAVAFRAEVRSLAGQGLHVLLVGRAGHAAVTALRGVADGAVTLVEDAAQARTVPVPDPARVAVALQPGLPVEESELVAERLRARFGHVVPQHPETYCYAAGDRRADLHQLAHSCQLLLVVSPEDDPDTAHALALADGPAVVRRVSTAADLAPHWLAGVASIGLTRTARSPEDAVTRLLPALAGLGPTAVVTTRAGRTSRLEPTSIG